MTIYTFVALVAFGIGSGLILEFGRAMRVIFNKNLFATVILDFVATLCVGVVFIYAQFLLCNFNLSVYSICAFVGGILIERATLGFLLAKKFKSFYTYVEMLLKRIKNTKFGKGIFK